MSELRGIGLGLRRQFADALLDHPSPAVDWIEITPENWMFYGGRHTRRLERARERWPVVSHSVSLNVGGIEPLDPVFLDATRELVRRLGSPFFSDHICYSSAGGGPVHDLLPLPFTREAVAHTARRAREAQARVASPLVLENATFYSHMPGAEMDEGDFLRAVLDESGCGMLLDVNNIYVNAQNHGFDARAFLDRMPFERVRQIHVAGHTRQDDTIIDTHIGPVIDPVWDLYAHALRRAGRLVPTLIEWDQEIPDDLEMVLAEVRRARSVAEAALR
jgi:uncharacterized protein (UPF0276 family)